MPTKVAACQVPDIRKNMHASLEWIERFSKQAEDNNVALICFPECFLQGYLTDASSAKEHAVDLASPAFENILQRLKIYKPVIVAGLIEEDNGYLFNTAVVIQKGKLPGKYRKTHLLEGEKIFIAGCEYPVFQIHDLQFGINICYDTRFPEAAASIAKQGATLILCPAHNMMRYETAEKFKHLHHSIRAARARETNLWLVSSDVTGEGNGRISYGPTSAIDPNGNIVAQVPLMETGMIIVDINSF